MALTALTFAWLIWSYVKVVQAKPQFGTSEVLFQEWTASGNSDRNLFTRIGGATNCLRLVVTKDFLWVTTYFPFSFFAAFGDLEHVIPLRSISSVESMSGVFGKKRVNVTFINPENETRTLYLYPKNAEAFLAAVGSKK